MRFPWSKPKSNTDGGPKTALFSFDRERERQMAAWYSGDRQDWLEARYVLIDEVLSYRRTGRLTPSLFEACETEYAVASWTRSEGVRRLIELSLDGHSEAVERLEALMASKDWRDRHEALLGAFERVGDKATRTRLAKRGLADRSARIRQATAEQTVFAHLPELAPDIEAAARIETEEKRAEALYQSAWYLRRNVRTGDHGRFGGDEHDRAAFAMAWADFQRTR